MGYFNNYCVWANFNRNFCVCYYKAKEKEIITLKSLVIICCSVIKKDETFFKKINKLFFFIIYNLSFIKKTFYK